MAVFALYNAIASARRVVTVSFVMVSMELCCMSSVCEDVFFR